MPFPTVFLLVAIVIYVPFYVTLGLGAVGSMRFHGVVMVMGGFRIVGVGVVGGGVKGGHGGGFTCSGCGGGRVRSAIILELELVTMEFK